MLEFHFVEQRNVPEVPNVLAGQRLLGGTGQGDRPPILARDRALVGFGDLELLCVVFLFAFELVVLVGVVVLQACPGDAADDRSGMPLAVFCFALFCGVIIAGVQVTQHGVGRSGRQFHRTQPGT